METRLIFCEPQIDGVKEPENKDLAFEGPHYMPCLIDHNGEANIDTHFTKYIESDNESQGEKGFRASFRGYPLRGRCTHAPNDYSFLLLTETKAREEEEEVATRSLRETHRFEEFIHWGVSQRPPYNDTSYQAFKWIDIAGTIHSD